MNLFFDGVSSNGYIALFSDEREIVHSDSFHILGNESSKATDLIDNFLKKSGQSYENIENIVVVAGPGSFTGIRTISLIVNTLAYVYPNISLTSMNYFDLFQEYPIIKASSKRDLFVKYEKNAKICIESNIDFIENIDSQLIYGDAPNLVLPDGMSCESNLDYTRVIGECEFEGLKKIAPLYIKKPNIS